MPFLFKLQRYPAVVAGRRQQADQVPDGHFALAQRYELPLVVSRQAHRVFHLYVPHTWPQNGQDLLRPFAHSVWVVRVIYGTCTSTGI